MIDKIVTDKKAKNLTLTVCHLGQPVQPSDAADVEKEYRLLDLTPDTN